MTLVFAYGFAYGVWFTLEVVRRWPRVRAWRRSRCFFGCKRCRLHDTADGIGGRCERCGTVHGWVTREELRRIGEIEQRVRARERSGQDLNDQHLN